MRSIATSFRLPCKERRRHRRRLGAFSRISHSVHVSFRCECAWTGDDQALETNRRRCANSGPAFGRPGSRARNASAQAHWGTLKIAWSSVTPCAAPLLTWFPDSGPTFGRLLPALAPETLSPGSRLHPENAWSSVTP